MDGTGSGTVFNGPVPLLDAMYASATNYITGMDCEYRKMIGHNNYTIV